MSAGFVKFFQSLFYWITRGLFAVLIKQNKNLEALELSDNAYLMIANHQSHADGFLMFTALPWRMVTRLLPTGIMGKNRYTNHPLKKLFTGPIGMFPAHKNKHYTAGLKRAAELLDEGFSIAIFPEGHIGKARQNRPHRGAAVLATKNRLPIIPIHVEWNKNRLRRSVSISYGAPFCLLPQRKLSSATAYLMDTVYKT